MFRVRCGWLLLAIWGVTLITEWQGVNAASSERSLDLCYVCFGPCKFVNERFMTTDILKSFGWTEYPEVLLMDLGQSKSRNCGLVPNALFLKHIFSGPEPNKTFNMVREYFRLVTAKVAEAARKMDPDLKVSYRGTYQRNNTIWLSNLVPGPKKKDAINKAIRTYTVSNVQKLMHQVFKCDATFLTSPAQDRVFLISGVQGIANTGQLCQKASTAIVSMHANINIQASIVAHELGHLLLMYHDTESPPTRVVNMANINPHLKPEVDKILSTCRGANDCGCPDPKGCIMGRDGSHPDALIFSNCSKAYYDMFKDLSEEYEGYYVIDCFLDMSDETNSTPPAE